MPAPYNSITIANRFLELADEQGAKLTPMQLIKMVYIAHGFSLAIFKRPLIDETVEAWRYGPVIPSLYQKLKSYGSGKVSAKIRGMFGRGDEALAEADDELIRIVYNKYGKFSGVQLSHLTHRPGTPWAEAYEPGSYGLDIDDSVIRTHYATLLSR